MHFLLAFRDDLPVIIVDGSEMLSAGVNVDCLLDDPPVQAVLNGVVASQGFSETVSLR